MARWGYSRKCKQTKLGGNRRHGRKEKDVRHRASPARIMKLYPHLTAGQRKLIEDAGFGGLLKIHCPVVPARLCTWLLRRFDTESCELVIKGRGRIPVTVDSVHRVLGIPNSGRDVEYKLDEGSINFVFDKYGVTKPPSVVSLEKLIKNMKSADEHFLRTFMMLVVSTFLCPNTSLKISPRCFLSLVDIGSIRELNWCKFVVEQLRKCISSYGRKNSVGGCLFYLVILYLDSLDARSVEIPRAIPRISAWNRKLIDDVIVMDMKNNSSFGKCFLKRGDTGDINSRGASVLFGDVSAIANFVSSNVLPGYSPQKKEVLCNATSNLCSSITDALSKFMREVSRLEGCSREAGKGSTGAAPREDNNVENNGDCSVSADKDISGVALIEDNNMEKNGDCSGEADKDINGVALIEDNNVENNGDQILRQWKNFITPRLCNNGDQMDVGTLPKDSSELANKDIEDTSDEEYEDGSSGDDEAGDSSSVDSEDDPDWEDDSNRIKRNMHNSEGDGTTKSGERTRKGSVHDSDIPEGDHGEHVSLAKVTSGKDHGELAVPIPSVSQARSKQQKNDEKRSVIEDKMAIQSAGPLRGGPSNLKLCDNWSPSNSKGDMNMDKTAVIDLSTPTSSDSECTTIRNVANPPFVSGPEKSP